MNTLTKVGLATGAVIITTGIIISSRTMPPAPVGTKSAVMRDAQSGRCFQMRSDGWTEPVPCPTPTRNTLPRVTP